MTDLDAVIAAVTAKARYADLAPELVREVARRELAKRGGVAAAAKAARAKLHQMVGAYDVGKLRPAAWIERVEAAAGDQDMLRALADEALAHHASTREREGHRAEIESAVFAGLPPGATVLDLACGLHPLALPQMGLPEMALPGGVTYLACDVCLPHVAMVAAWLKAWGQPGGAFAWDLLAGPPPRAADCVLLLKALPCLEQVDKTLGRRLLAEIEAPLVVVSYPVSSLGGRNVGMAGHYAARFAETVRGLPWDVEPVPVTGELIYRLHRR